MYSWDESKRLKNLRKHRIDFRDVAKVFEGFTITSEDDRNVYGERRFLTIGFLKEQVVMVAHSDPGDEIRIISMRKATRRETRFYFSQIPD
jgi:hypothetical protein